MEMRAAFVAFLVVSILGAAQAADWTSRSKPGDGSRFSFRGNEIGDPIARMEPFFWNRESNVFQCYSDRNLPGFKACRDTSIDGLAGQSKIEDLPVKHLFYEYLDDQLVGFLLTTSTDHFDALRALITLAYGPPHQVERSSLHDRDSKAFDQVVSVWNTPHGPMTLTKRARTTSESSLRLLDSAAAKKLAATARTKRETSGN
jgi:hypothetical protein